MESIKTRKIGINDIDQLQEIGIRTFDETFSSINSEENMTEYLESGFSRDKLKAELSDQNSEFYFAELNKKTIGYLKINFGLSQKELKDENSLEIERLYVLKEYQGKRVGKILYEKAIEISKRKKVDFVWLGVWEDNFRAKRFYKKQGFEEFDKHIFTLGKDDQTDIMMKLKMK